MTYLKNKCWLCGEKAKRNHPEYSNDFYHCSSCDVLWNFSTDVYTMAKQWEDHAEFFDVKIAIDFSKPGAPSCP